LWKEIFGVLRLFPSAFFFSGCQEAGKIIPPASIAKKQAAYCLGSLLGGKRKPALIVPETGLLYKGGNYSIPLHSCCF